MKKTLKNVLEKIARPITDKVLNLKGRHKGESCYILGDGISVKWFDLGTFPKKPALTLSCVPFHKQASSLNIRYSLLVQPYYFYPYVKHLFYDLLA